MDGEGGIYVVEMPCAGGGNGDGDGVRGMRMMGWYVVSCLSVEIMLSPFYHVDASCR